MIMVLSMKLIAEEIYVAPFLFVDGGSEDYVLDKGYQDAEDAEIDSAPHPC